MPKRQTCFLWGPRQTGKSTLLKKLYPEAEYHNLLLSSEYSQLARNPGILRERFESQKLTGDSQKFPIIIDEIQKVPEILDEVHWMIENKGLYFILSGSSARKLRRGHGNLLGGRAFRRHLRPLVSSEIPDFDLIRALNHGLLPPHYPAEDPRENLLSYVGDYLNEEILAEAITRSISGFGHFLEAASFSNGELVNFENIARESGVKAQTVASYFHILEDTLIGNFLPAFRKKAKRRQIIAPKFYFFDIGIANHLARRGRIEPGSELFGRAFEHFIQMEITAHSEYSGLNYPVAFWRTASGYEVDFILGSPEIAVEAKATAAAHTGHLKGLRAFGEEFDIRRRIVVSLDPAPRKTEDGIEILPWADFLRDLWAGKMMY